MRIGIVCYPTFGGSGVVATELGLEMAQLGHDVHFISYSRPVRLSDNQPNTHYHEVVVSDYPLFDYSPYELVLTSRLVSIVKKEQLDILHVHYAIPHASAALMAKRILSSQGINIPIVCTLHGTDITLVGKDASFEPVITYAINNSDAVTAVSESLRKDTYENFGVDRDIEVIPNFINLSMYSSEPDPAIRNEYVTEDEPIIVHVSNFRKVKRVQDVVHVFAKIKRTMNAQLLLIGDGPERYRIEQLSRALSCTDNIHFLGKMRHVEPYLASGDLFILPSETESFGLAALEAMASGMPVISTNTGGLPEVNKHGYSGFLSDVGDIEDMCVHALSILERPERLEQFKAQAKEQAATFDLGRILPKYTALYEKLILSLE